jgi:hypothetical protein
MRSYGGISTLPTLIVKENGEDLHPSSSFPARLALLSICRLSRTWREPWLSSTADRFVPMIPDVHEWSAGYGIKMMILKPELEHNEEQGCIANGSRHNQWTHPVQSFLSTPLKARAVDANLLVQAIIIIRLPEVMPAPIPAS